MREETAQIKIRGMICRSCTDAVEETLLHTPGVISARVSYIKGRAELRYDPDIVSLEQIKNVSRLPATTPGTRECPPLRLT